MNKGIKEGVTVNVIVNNRAGGNAPLIAREIAGKLLKKIIEYVYLIFLHAAVLADKTWLKKISEIEGILIPGLTIKTFSRGQKEEAEAWLES